jgi:hypothetical protein
MTTTVSALALHAPCSIDLLELIANMVHPMDQSTSVNFQLRLTRSPRTNTTRLLAERSPGSSKSGQSILQERQLYLRLSLRRAGILGKYVKDHCRPINRRTPKYLFQVALLRGRKIVLKHDGVGINGETDIA